MRLFLILSFLTFVGISSSLAAPNPTSPRPGLPQETQESTPSLPDPRLEDVRLAEPPGVPHPLPSLREERSSHARHPDWSWQLHLGLLGGAYVEKDKTINVGYFGGRLLRTYELGTIWDFGLDMTGSSLLNFSMGRQRPWGENPQFAPYWKWGVSQTVPSNEFFGGLGNLERVKALVAAGLGDLLGDQSAWNAEFVFAWGLRGTGFQLQTGRTF